jgi:hypothetical protein
MLQGLCGDVPQVCRGVQGLLCREVMELPRSNDIWAGELREFPQLVVPFPPVICWGRFAEVECREVRISR